MKLQKSTFAFVLLILALLACNLPGSEVPTAEPPSPTVEAPVTIIVIENTPTTAPVATETPTPTSTPSIPAELTLSTNSNCRLGPSGFYNIVDQISSGQVLPASGRNEDNTWWQVTNATDRKCWIFHENAQANSDFSSLPIESGPPLPSTPSQFYVTQQQCQPGSKKFTVTLKWTGGADADWFRLYRDGSRIAELKVTNINYKDANAPLNKNLTYEIEAYNENGTSQKAIQVVPACK